jgi:hypothetical protein
MKSWVFAAGLLAAAAALPAEAADVDGAPPPKGGPYSEPYDGYRYGPKGPPSYNDDEDDDRYDDRAPSKKYSDRYDDNPPTPKKYSTVPPKYAPPPGKGCVRSEQVREGLEAQGWRDFHAGQPVNGSVVTIRARRPSGRLFELTLDRCSGEIVEARPLQLRPFGPYAYREPYGPFGAWRWGPEKAPYANEDDWPERPFAYRGPRRWWYRD